MPLLVCVMGVSGAGKSTVGAALAETLGLPFLDADDLHPAENRALMAAGTALTDTDRGPWLDDVAAAMAAHQKTGLVVACSVLRRDYRDRIRSRVPDVVFVHIAGSRELLAARAAARVGHFMPPSLLDSQFATLEPLDGDEGGMTMDASLGVRELVAVIAAGLAGR